MGCCCSNVLSKYAFTSCYRFHHTAVIYGLDGAGKTTLLFRHLAADKKKRKEQIVPTATPGTPFNHEKVKYQGDNFDLWDLGGSERDRQLWHHWWSTQITIFVIDASDRCRIDEAKNELDKLLNEKEHSTDAFLILANKQDEPNAMTALELKEGLGLNALWSKFEENPCVGMRIQEKRRLIVLPISALTGEGIEEAKKCLFQALYS